MKPVISYYGGKQNLKQYILPLIPQHKTYIEPFIGGGTIYWAKQPSTIEHINDYDMKITNLYEVIKNQFEQFKQYLIGTAHVQSLHREANEFIKQFNEGNKIDYDKVKLAWSIWLSSNLSFLKIIGSGFAFATTNNECNSTTNRKNRSMDINYSKRLQNTNIHTGDAIDLIKQHIDCKDTFFYFDPPYDNSNCGNYQGTQEVFDRLLQILPLIKGKWILSSYPTNNLFEYRKNFNWNVHDIIQRKLINRPEFKTQCITTNFNDVQSCFEGF